MYQALYAPLPDAAKYLARLGISDKIEPTRENLDRLVYAHLTHVPFENLDECMDRACPDLAVEALYDKIVTRRRGGYCFELNAAFYALLCACGYEAYPVACRISWNSDEKRPLSHRATVVVLDGVKHFCDVGFGGPSAHCSVPFNETVDGGFFIDTADNAVTKVKRKTERGEELIIEFKDEFFEPVDFVPLNFHIAMAPGSYFLTMPIINLTTDTGSKSINGDVFRWHNGDTVTETKLENDELFNVCLKEHFGIVK